MSEIQSKIEYRDFLIEELVKEYLGPGSEEIDNDDNEFERISESPLKRYFAGIIYPQKTLVGEDDVDPVDKEIELSTDDTENSTEFENNSEDKIPILATSNSDAKEDFQDKTITYANQYCPSSYGITFFITGNKNIKLKIEAAKYQKLPVELSFVSLKSRDHFIKDLPNGDAFRVEKDKLFYSGRIDKNLRKEIKNYCTNLFLNSLELSKAEHIKELIDHNKYYELTDNEKEGINKYYLIFSRIYDKSKNFRYRGYKRIPCESFTKEISLNEVDQEIKKDWNNEKFKYCYKKQKNRL